MLSTIEGGPKANTSANLRRAAVYGGVPLAGAAVGAKALTSQPAPGMLEQGMNKVKDYAGQAGDWIGKNPGTAAAIGVGGIGAAALLHHLLSKHKSESDEGSALTE